MFFLLQKREKCSDFKRLLKATEKTAHLMIPDGRTAPTSQTHGFDLLCVS